MSHPRIGFTAFVNIIHDNVHLAGCTINVYDGMPHVQTYAFVMSLACVEYISNATTIFSESYDSIAKVVDNQEVQLSTKVLQNGWNLSCLVCEYSRQNYKTISRFFNPAAYVAAEGDICFPLTLCFGRSLHPFEVMFCKTADHRVHEAVPSLTRSYNF